MKNKILKTLAISGLVLGAGFGLVGCSTDDKLAELQTQIEKTYTVTFDCGVPDLFNNYTEEVVINSGEWITNIPTIKNEYKSVFSGWYISGTNKQVVNFDFIGGDVVLEARIQYGLYQNGECVKTWQEIEEEFTSAFNHYNEIVGNGAWSYFNSLNGDLVISNEITGIKDNAFRDCTGLTSVVIPSSVTSLGDDAFMDCTTLTRVVISSGVRVIRREVFRGCTSLTNITVNEFNNAYKSIDGNLYTKDGEELIQYAIGKTATSFVIPSTETNVIGYQAFYGCGNLINVTIPSCITNIGYQAFRGCTSLTNITVSGFNNTYKSIDGNLYTKDGKELIQYAIGKTATSFDIPQGVTDIGNYAFYSCDSLINVTIPNSVTEIGYSAFEGCGGLTSITIPHSVTDMGQGAFADCSNLKVVTILNGITTIGDLIFAHCINLEYIYLPSSILTIAPFGPANSPFHSDGKLTIYCERSTAPFGWNTYWNNNGIGYCAVQWNKTIDDFNIVAHPYKETVEQINNSLNDGKTILNDVANNTLSANTKMQYDDGTLFEFSKTNNFIHWTTENYEYLDLYKSGTNLMYSANYNAEDVDNCYIHAEDVSVIEEDAFDYRVKNRLHIIPEVTNYISKIEAVENFDYYTIKVTITFAPESSFVIEYKVKDNKINGMNIDGEEVRFYTSNNNYTYNSAKFSSLTKLTIDETFVEDTSIIDFTMLENVDTVEISPSLTVPEYVTNNFTLTGTEGNFKVYTKNK